MSDFPWTVFSCIQLFAYLFVLGWRTFLSLHLSGEHDLLTGYIFSLSSWGLSGEYVYGEQNLIRSIIVTQISRLHREGEGELLLYVCRMLAPVQ